LTAVFPPIAADSAEERRRHECARHAAEQRAGGEAREVGHDAAAETDDRGAPFESGLEEPVVDDREPREVLVLLAVRDLDDGRLEPAGAERVLERAAVQGGNTVARDHAAPAAEPDLGEPRTDVAQEARPDEDRVGARAELDPDLLEGMVDLHARHRRPSCHRRLTDPPRARRRVRRPRRR
jgi:hypothetical protein